MPWFLVDDQFPTDDRVLAISLAARGLWVTAGAWSSNRHRDDVPDHVLAALGSTPELEDELRTARVWRRIKGAYRFEQHGLCKIPAKETVDKQREMKTERQRRWRENHGRRDVDASTAPSTWVPTPTPTPYPAVAVATDRASPSTARAPTPKPISSVNGRQPPPLADVLATQAALATHDDDPPLRGRHARKDHP